MTGRPRSTLFRHGTAAVVAAALLFGLTYLLSDYRNNQLSEIAYFVCAAGGLSLLTGLNGQLSLGHGALMAVGAYAVAVLLIHQHWSQPDLELVVALVAAVVAAGIVGAVVGLAAARLRGPYLAGATLAFAVGLPSLVNYKHFTGFLGGANGLSIPIPAGPAAVPALRWQAWICCLAAVVTLLVLANVASSRVGRSMRAVRDDEVAAALCGLPVARVQVLTFVISAGCAGLGGGLLATVNTLAAPGAFPVSLSLSLLAVVVLGGLGSLAGAVYGSVLLTLLPVWITDLARTVTLPTDVQSNLPLAVYGVTLAAVVLVFPRGLQGGLRVAVGRLGRLREGRAP